MGTATHSKQSVGELKTLIVQVVQEVLHDPDFGLELTEEAKRRLRKALRTKQKTISFQEAKKKYL